MRVAKRDGRRASRATVGTARSANQHATAWPSAMATLRYRTVAANDDRQQGRERAMLS
jgi:hypothetical protein